VQVLKRQIPRLPIGQKRCDSSDDLGTIQNSRISQHLLDLLVEMAISANKQNIYTTKIKYRFQNIPRPPNSWAFSGHMATSTGQDSNVRRKGGTHV
jgi:hypothetical protein